MRTYLRRTDIIIKWLCIGALVYAVSTIISLITINGSYAGTSTFLDISTAVFDLVSLIIFLTGMVYGITGIIFMVRSVKEKKRLKENDGFTFFLKGIFITVFIYSLLHIYNIVVDPFGLTLSLQGRIILL